MIKEKRNRRSSSVLHFVVLIVHVHLETRSVFRHAKREDESPPQGVWKHYPLQKTKKGVMVNKKDDCLINKSRAGTKLRVQNSAEARVHRSSAHNHGDKVLTLGRFNNRKAACQ